MARESGETSRDQRSVSPTTADGCSSAQRRRAGGWADADPDRRRELIVERSLELLQDKGLAAVTMRAVAGRLGVGTMTLYTYVDGQHGLHREMVRHGFEMLGGDCRNRPAPTCAEDWLAGGRAYLQFAMDHPNLYRLMFDTFDAPLEPDHEVLHGGFQPYLERVTEYLACRGVTCAETLSDEARRRAGRWWIALHGLAMLALAGRLCVLQGDLDDLLRDLLPRVGPM